jgi:hypothetical protein
MMEDDNWVPAESSSQQLMGINHQHANALLPVRLRELSIFLTILMRKTVDWSTQNTTSEWTTTVDANHAINCEVRRIGYVEQANIGMPTTGRGSTVPHRDSSTERARSSHRQLFRLSLTDGKTATADDSSLSPPRPNISRLDQVAGLQLTVTVIRLVSTRGCLGISISSTPSA